MSLLRVTAVDVGWGDSILVESQDQQGLWKYGLIDSNDGVSERSSYIFLKRLFERKQVAVPFKGTPIFEWVLLTHAHADHGQGLRRILGDFGARQFWYSRSSGSPVFLTTLIRFATRSPKVHHHQHVDTGSVLPGFGGVQMVVLWPQPNQVSSNENDNSVVLALTLGSHTIVLTGDAEADGVWNSIASTIPSTTRVFKVPHHGADNGVFDSKGATPWLGAIPKGTEVVISSHVRPFNHPSQKVITALQQAAIDTYRTDQHFHVTFETDGSLMSVQYSHV